MRNRWFAVAVGVGILMTAGRAGAGVITYSNLADWQAAVGAITSISFEENSPGDFTLHGCAGFDVLTFCLSPSGSLYTVDPAYGEGFSEIGTGDVLSAQVPLSTTAVKVFGLDTYAISFDFEKWDGEGLSVKLSTGEVFALSSEYRVAGFFGVTSTVPFTNVQIIFDTDILNIDNFAFATASPVPEPASLLLGAGLASLALRRRLRRPA